MKNFLKWCKDMYTHPIDVADFFMETHLKDSTRFKNFEISFWEHLKNTFIYPFYEVILIFFLFVNTYTKKEKVLTIKLFPVIVKFIWVQFWVDIHSIYKYIYIQIRYHLSI